jgi:hypothetical protein
VLFLSALQSGRFTCAESDAATARAQSITLDELLAEVEALAPEAMDRTTTERREAEQKSAEAPV